MTAPMTLIITADDGTDVAVTVARIKWAAFCNKCGFFSETNGDYPQGLVHDGCPYAAVTSASTEAADPSLLVAVIEMRRALADITSRYEAVETYTHGRPETNSSIVRARAALSRVREATDV